MFELIFLVIVFSVVASVARRGFHSWTSQITGAASQLDTLLPQIEAQLRNYQNLPAAQRMGQNPQLAAMLLKAQNEMRQIDALHKARYETRVGDIAGMAASAGIDFKPDRW